MDSDGLGLSVTVTVNVIMTFLLLLAYHHRRTSHLVLIVARSYKIQLGSVNWAQVWLAVFCLDSIIMSFIS